jgi:hypothetical protein
VLIFRPPNAMRNEEHMMQRKSEPDNKKPLNEQTLRERYPNVCLPTLPTSSSQIYANSQIFANFTFENLTPDELISYEWAEAMSPEDQTFDDLTLNELIEVMSRKSGKCFVSKFLPSLIQHNTEQLCCDFLYDFLIEAAKKEHEELVKPVLQMLTKKKATACKYILCKYINSIIVDSGSSPISGYLNPNTLELMLCAQNMPTELLQIVSAKIDRIIFDPYDGSVCLNLILKNYYDTCIVRYLSMAKGLSNIGHFDQQNDKLRIEKIDSAIENLKFLSEIIEKYFPKSRWILQNAAAKLCSSYKNMLYQYHPQLTQELPFVFNSKELVLSFNSAQSVEQKKDNVVPCVRLEKCIFFL